MEERTNYKNNHTTASYFNTWQPNNKLPRGTLGQHCTIEHKEPAMIQPDDIHDTGFSMSSLVLLQY